MRIRHTSIRLRHAAPLGALLSVAASVACIPSFPPCDCTKADETGGPADFPDFQYLDRSQPCADIPLPGGDTGGTDTGTDTGTGTGGGGELECGYPDGPYGFRVGDVFENLELFDCDGNQVQIAQYLPQVGLPDVETRGVVFGVGAIWCDPCRMEGEEWAAHFADDYGPQGIQFIQALDEGAAGSPVIPASCAGWRTEVADDKFPILYTPDQGALRAKIEAVPAEPIPFTLIFDANANIIFRQTGGVVDSGILTVQLDSLLNDPYGN